MTHTKNYVLTQDYLKSVLEYNRETGVFLWRERKQGRKLSRAGTLSPNGYCYININGKQHSAHRLVWLYVYGEFPTGRQNYIDHINKNKSDNRVENLRVCTQAENLRNTSKHFDNRSGFKGIYYNKTWGKWVAQIQNPTTRLREYLGGHTTEEAAEAAYRLKALEYSGDFYPVETQNGDSV